MNDTIDDHYVSASNISEGWLDAVRLLQPRPKATRQSTLIVRIADPQR